jgi:hypothetical protein
MGFRLDLPLDLKLDTRPRAASHLADPDVAVQGWDSADGARR